MWKRNVDLATTFESIAIHGAKKGFYSGQIAKAIVEAVAEFGGVLDLDDLDHHKTASDDPISIVFRGYRIYETPPPTHGLAALIALGILERVCPEPHNIQNVSFLFASVYRSIPYNH
jgi:gamma-glutamyltranspeptidase/glutathione hydrolase